MYICKRCLCYVVLYANCDCMFDRRNVHKHIVGAAIRKEDSEMVNELTPKLLWLLFSINHDDPVIVLDY